MCTLITKEMEATYSDHVWLLRNTCTQTDTATLIHLHSHSHKCAHTLEWFIYYPLKQSTWTWRSKLEDSFSTSCTVPCCSTAVKTFILSPLYLLKQCQIAVSWGCCRCSCLHLPSEHHCCHRCSRQQWSDKSERTFQELSYKVHKTTNSIWKDIKQSQMSNVTYYTCYFSAN